MIKICNVILTSLDKNTGHLPPITCLLHDTVEMVLFGGLATDVMYLCFVVHRDKARPAFG